MSTTDQHATCARFKKAIELIGGRWTGAILNALFADRHRFAEIRMSIPGMSDTMLVQRLRELGAAGVVERRVIPSTPVRVEYYLTEKGRELEPVLNALAEWSHKWILLPADDAHLDGHGVRQFSTGTPGSNPHSIHEPSYTRTRG
jgi:DNA-binding HxlR family transcriptional regulator